MAEIMVVLFIMTIILAAFAPLMTVRAKSTSRTSPWNWATPDSANTYFGVHPNQRVMIGQKTKGDDINNKLTVNVSGSQAHILFKKDNTLSGQLLFQNNNLILGGNTTNLKVPSSIQNTILGVNAMPNISSGQGNTIVGTNANATNTYGYYNTAVGVSALNQNTASANTAVGRYALYNNTTGEYNVALGVDTMLSNTTGNYNTATGYIALRNNTTGRENVAVGLQALQNNISGSYNVAVGTCALVGNTSGSRNTAIGYGACGGVNSNYTTCLGMNSGPNNTDTIANNVYIGNQYSNVYVYGTTELKTLIASSDARLKNIQGDYTSGLEQIKKIKPVNFTFKDDKKKTPRVGVIAQDLQKIFPKAVMKGDDGFLKIRQEDMFYSMINAIKDLAYRDDAKDKKIKELESRIEQLEKLVK